MIILVWGTRPEAIKLGPIAAALKAQHTPFVSIATGQHWDLLRGTPAETDLADSVSLGLPANGDPLRWVTDAAPALDLTLHSFEPPLGKPTIVVQGDTASALAGARFATRWQLPLVHIEAGVRSGNLQDPWPEEGFRREITQLASWHFAPTQTAVENLLAEGVSEDAIFLTGNPGVSALYLYTDFTPGLFDPWAWDPPHLLFTMHRREWRLAGIQGVLDGLREAAVTYPHIDIWWPVHPGVPLPAGWRDTLPKNVRAESPCTYWETINLLSKSVGVMTDSGGLVEEAATLGVPTAVMRYHTDRPEAIEAGIARIYPPTHQGILDAFEAIVNRSIPRTPTTVYGSPDAASQIATHLRSLVCPATSKSLMASGSSPVGKAT